jgi:microcystin-dependent protein
MLGGVLNLPLTSGTVFNLTIPSGISPAAGPTQSQNAMITFTGSSLSAGCFIKIFMPGRYVFNNLATFTNATGAITISSPNGVGQAYGQVGLPPGQMVSVITDGNAICQFIDAPCVGAALDYQGSNGPLPPWMLVTNPYPYLYKDGTTYNISQYPYLGALLGSTFGGNGVTTFAVPDERARTRVGVDIGATGRMTQAVVAYFMGSAGGEQSHTLLSSEIALHNHPASDSGHTHPLTPSPPGAAAGYATSGGFFAGGGNSGGSVTVGTGFANISVGNNPGGGSAHNNVQPCIVSSWPLIKT